MASYSIIDVTATTVTIRATGLTVGTATRYFVRLADDPDDITADEHHTALASTMTVSIEGLLPSTDYVCNVMDADYGEGQDNWIGAQYFTTRDEAQRPWDWEWWSTVEAGEPIGLTAVEWNTFTNLVNEFRAYTGLDTVSFTEVSSGTLISADIVNEAWDAIAEMTGTSIMPDWAYYGGKITADLFLGLRDALNSID